MSNDLISREKALEIIRSRLNSSEEGTLEYQHLYSILTSVDELPIAYNMDRVVEQIELLSENTESDDLYTYEEKVAYNTAYLKAIEIAKAGGMDED